LLLGLCVGDKFFFESLLLMLKKRETRELMVFPDFLSGEVEEIEFERERVTGGALSVFSGDPSLLDTCPFLRSSSPSFDFEELVLLGSESCGDRDGIKGEERDGTEKALKGLTLGLMIDDGRVLA
jgi:hypothetical protein